MVEYDFTKGLYRAFVRTGYKNGNNEIQSIDGNKYPFESNYVSPVPIITDVTVDTTNKTVTFTWTSDSSPDQIHIYLDTSDPYWEHMTCTSPYTINSQQIQDGSYYVIIISGNGVPSAPYYFSVDFNLYVFSTNPDIKINSVTLEVPNASLSQTTQAYGLTYKLYSNGLLVISGAMTSYRSDPYHDLGSIPHDSLYIYFAGSNVYYENLFGVSFYNVKEIAYYSESYGTAGTSAADMFENCASLLNIDFGNSFSTYRVTNMNEMFMSCINLTTLDLSKAAMFSTLQVTNMVDMFRSCTRLTSINFGQFFSTFNVTMTSDMFYDCQSLTSLDLSGWSSLYSLHYAEYMFANCISLESINLGTISIFSTISGYYGMSGMFKNCRSLTSLDVSGFKVQYVTSAREAFANCSSLTSLDFSNWRPTQAYLGNEGLIDGCTALETLTVFAPRQDITLPKKMYDRNGTEYTVIPYTSSSSSSQRITVYATNPTVNTNNLLSLRSVPANLLRAVSENRNVEYDFTEGLYRAYVRTTYKNGYNIENYIISNKYPFDINSNFIDTGLGWGANKHYLFYDKDMIVDTVPQPNWYTRDFFKLNDGWCICVHSYPSNTGFCGPIMISSKDPNGRDFAAYYRTQWGYEETYGDYEFAYLGMTWRMTYFAQWMAGNYNHNIAPDTAPEFDITPYGEDMTLIGQAILDAAGVKILKQPDTWEPKTWNGLPSDVLSRFSGYNVWTDGNNIYYSQSDDQYVLNKSTDTWNVKDWEGYQNLLGGVGIWTDGSNTYYSNFDAQYKLDKATNTWIQKTWNLRPSYGYDVWTDGNNVYYSQGTNHFILNKNTETWEQIQWSGLSSFNGRYIWVDGNNVYYSNWRNQYVLDKSISTWVPKTWNNLTEFDGVNIWTDSNNTYYSDVLEDKQYVLEKATNTWNVKIWDDFAPLSGMYIWKDGNNVYFSYTTSQYALS